MAQGVEGPSILFGGGDSPIADIVFVHGLRGNSIGTWTSGNVCWPRDLLGPHLQDVRIVTWGYDTSVANISNYSSQNSIFSHSENLLSDLGGKRYGQPDRPIIFVGHSLGGLVIKEALIRSSTYLHNRQDMELGAIYSSTVGIVFLGTPHRGSDKAGLAQIVQGIAKLALRKPNEKLLQNLERESDVLEHQRRNFASVSEKMLLSCLFEEKPTEIGLIVPESSACIDGYNVKTNSIPANHMGMCKFGSEDDLGYQRVFFHVHSLVREAKRRGSLSSRTDGSIDLQSAAPQPDQSGGKTELHYAATCGDRARVGRLLGLNKTKVDAADFNGMTALHHAVAKGRDNIILPLLRSGAQIEIYDDQGMTPLMHAAVAGPTESIVLLLRQGANASAQDKNGHTPAYHAFRHSNEPALLLLDPVEKGQKSESRFGPDALEFAITTRQPTVVVYLLGFETSRKMFIRRPSKHELWDGETAKALLSRNDFSIGTDYPIENGNVLHYAASKNKSYTISLAKMMLKIGMDLNSRTLPDWEAHQTILDMAIRNANLDLVQFLMDEKVDLENRSERGESALHIAVYEGNENFVKLLLDAGADIEFKNSEGEVPLHKAVENQQKGMTRLLLDAGADIEAKDSHKDTPLHKAITKKQEGTTRLLVDAGADIEARGSQKYTPLHTAACTGLESIVILLLGAGAKIEARTSLGQTPLHKAVENGHESAIILLLNAKADIEANSWGRDTPLHSAAWTGNVMITRFLLNANADIEAENSNGDTPLHVAVNARHVDTANYLLRRMDHKEGQGRLKNRLLLLAVKNNDVSMTDMLLANGADVDSQGVVGDRALHIAARNNSSIMTKLLLKWGANAADVDDRNRTASYWATQLGHAEVSSVLEAAGHRPRPQSAKDTSSSSKSPGKLKRVFQGSR